MTCPNSDCRNYCEAGKPRCDQCEIELRLPWEKPFTEMTIEERAERGRKLYELYEQGLEHSIAMCDWKCEQAHDDQQLRELIAREGCCGKYNPEYQVCTGFGRWTRCRIFDQMMRNVKSEE